MAKFLKIILIDFVFNLKLEIDYTKNPYYTDLILKTEKMIPHNNGKLSISGSEIRGLIF